MVKTPSWHRSFRAFGVKRFAYSTSREPLFVRAILQRAGGVINSDERDPALLFWTPQAFLSICPQEVPEDPVQLGIQPFSVESRLDFIRFGCIMNGELSHVSWQEDASEKGEHMTGLRRVLLAVLLLGASALVSTGAFAHEKQDQADVQLLRDAAAALRQSHPDLAQGLSQYADMEAKEWDTETEEEREKEEVGEKAEPQEEQREHVKH